MSERVAIIRAKLRWGSREIDRREIDGDWPDEIERHGFRYAPLARDIKPGIRELTYYEVPDDDDDC